MHPDRRTVTAMLATATAGPALAAARPSGAEAFDFLHGDWDVTHRRLTRRLVGDTQWQTFGGTCRARPILGGLGNFDENVIDLPAGRYEACTVRLFNAGTWAIHWIDGREPDLSPPPMRGAFEGGVGRFLAEEMYEGRSVKTRFLWHEITPRSATWEQAMSADGGATWETNWIMRFARRA